MQAPYTYINGQYVEAVYDSQRKVWVFPAITERKSA